MIKTLLIWICGVYSKENTHQSQCCGCCLTYFDSPMDIDLQPSWLFTYPPNLKGSFQHEGTTLAGFFSSSVIATINGVSCFWQTIELSIPYLCNSVHSLTENLECQLGPERFVSLEYLGTGLGCLWNFNKSVFHFLKIHSFPCLSLFSPVSHTLFWLLI